jgi:hypothetical protein
MMMGYRKLDGVLIGMTGQFAAMRSLSVWVYDDSTCERMNVDYDDAWMSAYDGMRVSQVGFERGTNATRGEEKGGGAFGEALRMACGDKRCQVGRLFC